MPSVVLSPEELRIIRHTIGAINPENRCTHNPWRNYFVAGEGHADLPTIHALTARGLMDKRGATRSGYDDVFYVTDAGICAAARYDP